MSNHRESKILKKLGLKSATENKPPVVSLGYLKYLCLTLPKKVQFFFTKYFSKQTIMPYITLIIQTTLSQQLGIELDVSVIDEIFLAGKGMLN